MRSVLLIALSVLVVVVAGGYGITWYLQASQTRSAIQNAIADFNIDHPLITYDAIQTSGFPSDVAVSIVNPRFNGRVDTLFKNLMPASAINQLPWNETLALDGSIDIAVNAFSDRYSLTVRGGWRNNSDIGDKTIAMQHQPLGDGLCLLQLAHGSSLFGHMWDFAAITQNDELWDQFRSLDCNNPGGVTKDISSGETLMQSGPVRVYITNDIIGDTRQLRLYVKITDSEITPKADALLATYSMALNPNNPSPTRFSVYGKQNAEIDMSYRGPSHWQSASLKDANFEANINVLDVTNQIGTTHITFQASNALAGDVRSSKLSLRSISTFSEAYDTLMRDMARNVVAQLYANQNGAYDKMQPFLTKHTPDALYAKLEPAIPNFHSLGKMTQSIDLTYQGNANFSVGDIALSNLEFSAAPYGITGQGTGKMAQGQLFPAAQLNLLCANCLRLIDDSMAYAARLERLLAAISESSPAEPNITPELTDGIKALLNALAQPTKNEGDTMTLRYEVVSDGMGAVTLNGKNLGEVMALYNQYVMPALQKSPPSPQPAPTH